MLRAVVVILVPLTLSWISPANAQEKKAPRGFVLEAGQHSLQDVVDKAAEFLGRNYLYTDSEVAQEANRVKLQKRLILDAIGCEEVMSQLLYLRGFTVVPIDVRRGIYEVVWDRGQRAPEISLRAQQLSPEDVMKKQMLKTYVVTAVPLQQLDARKASQQLRPFFTAGGGRNGLQFGTGGDSGSLLIRGYSDSVAAALKLLLKIDRPGEAKLPPDVTQQVHVLKAQVDALVKRTAKQTRKLEEANARIAKLEAKLAAKPTAKSGQK